MSTIAARLRPATWRTIRPERAELWLGALAVALLALIAGMLVFVFRQAWPSFAGNGLSWFLPGGNANTQLADVYHSPADPAHFEYHMRAWPIVYGTILSTGLAVLIALPFSLLCALFMVEFAPPGLARLMSPAVRFLAAVPSVVYGLIGILVLAPWVNDHLVSESFKLDVKPIVPIGGGGLLLATLILTVMIVPIMIAINADALRAVPRSWLEGSAALGVNRWRTMWRIGVRTARPAIAAGVVLATARALGEAIMLAMVSGSFIFAPNPLDGLNMLLEPIQPLAATIVVNSEGLTVKPFGQTLYAFAAVLLVSSTALSTAGWIVRRPLRR
ncbi:MAG TPA: phosphate ABC transporter permease subunit PstC, partial [Conexibacter sp.]|nr:phosphate ABC transporter permease subunit PstC [Conexibacter sp.]